MTRKFLDTWETEMLAVIGTGAGCTGLEMRTVFTDLKDSSVQDECTINSSAPTAVALTSAWSKVNTTVYTSSNGGDGSFLKPSFATGEIETSLIAGFTYVIGASVSFEGDNNDRYDFTIFKNGTPIGNFVSSVAHGGGDPVSLNPRVYVNSAGSNDVYSLGVRSFNAVDTINIISCVLYATIYPTNNP